MKRKIQLGVNLDHIATVRQVRGTRYPDFLEAIRATELGGADGITVHLREDRRHIQESDVWLVKKKSKLPLNLEMSIAPAVVRFALKVKPPKVCLVPEKRQELTTEGGLDCVREFKRLEKVVPALARAGAEVSLFVDPDLIQLETAHLLGAPVVELHTGAYAEAKGRAQKRELARLIKVSRFAYGIGLRVNAGHGLTTQNVKALKKMFRLEELNIGHAIVARAVFIGLENAVREMKLALKGL